MGCSGSKDDTANNTNNNEQQEKTRSLKRKINWTEINNKLVTDRAEASVKQRADMFKQFDPNGNGYLSLAEVDKGLKDILNVQDVFDAKPVIMRAFQKAKSLNPPGASKHGDDYIEQNEFRMLLVYLKHYMKLWEIFAKADDSDDRRLDKNEFAKVWPQVQSWGQGLTQDECWKEVNGEGNLVLFTEFATWAIDKQMAANKEENFA